MPYRLFPNHLKFCIEHVGFAAALEGIPCILPQMLVEITYQFPDFRLNFRMDK